MLIYEYLAERLSNGYERNGKHIRNADIDPVYTATAGALAGMISWLPAIHFDVIKTRMMAEDNPNRYRSVWHCTSVVVRVTDLTIRKFNDFYLRNYFRSRGSNHCFEVEQYWYYDQLLYQPFRFWPMNMC